jgi:hypothetical protein
MSTTRDPGYNAQNYTEQGGAKTVIAGTIAIPSGGVLEHNGLAFPAGTYNPSVTFTVALAAATGVGGAFSIANPFGEALIIDRLAINFAACSGASLDCGVGAAGVTVDNLIDGVEITAARFIASPIGTNGGNCATWGANQILSGTLVGGAVTGLNNAMAHITIRKA